MFNNYSLLLIVNQLKNNKFTEFVVIIISLQEVLNNLFEVKYKLKEKLSRLYEVCFESF